MKALTIWQPWASLIMAGAKPFEFRGWHFPASMIGQQIVNHAGARPIRRAEVEDLLHRLHGDEAWTTGLIKDRALPVLEQALSKTAKPLPVAAGLGTMILGKPISGSEAAERLGATLNDSDRANHSNWAWPVSGITPFAEPFECKGAQGFWTWPEPKDWLI